MQQPFVNAIEKRKRGPQYTSEIDRDDNRNQNISGPMFQQTYGEPSSTSRSNSPSSFQFAPPEHFRRTVYHVPRGHNRTTTQQTLRDLHNLVSTAEIDSTQTQPPTPQHSPTHDDPMDDESNIN